MTVLLLTSITAGMQSLSCPQGKQVPFYMTASGPESLREDYIQLKYSGGCDPKDKGQEHQDGNSRSRDGHPMPPCHDSLGAF